MELVVTGPSLMEELKVLKNIIPIPYSGPCPGCWIEIFSNESSGVCPRCGKKYKFKD